MKTINKLLISGNTAHLIAQTLFEEDWTDLVLLFLYYQNTFFLFKLRLKRWHFYLNEKIKYTLKLSCQYNPEKYTNGKLIFCKGRIP